MEFWQGLLLITGIHILAAASPGPDFVLMSQQTLLKGRRVGLWCSLGITLGLMVHIVYSVMGLAAVIAHSQPLLTFIKWLGGGYLLYLGWQGVRAQPKEGQHLSEQGTYLTSRQAGNDIKNRNIKSSNIKSRDIKNSDAIINDSAIKTTLRRGFLCNVLNPKATLYFLSVFTVVLSPSMPTWQLAVYGVWMMVIQMSVFAAMVVMLSMPMVQRRFAQFEHWIDRVLGMAMMGLGLNLLLRSSR